MKSAFVRRARSRYSSALAAFSRSSQISFATSSSTSGVLSSSAMARASFFLGLELRVDDLLSRSARSGRRGFLRLRRGRFVELLRELLGGRLEGGDRL